MTSASGTTAIRQAATVALLRDHPEEGVQVLLLRRHAGLVFGANADVFPGGAVDVGDHESDGQKSLADFGWRMAAVRECFEEAGLLLSTAAPEVTAAQIQQLRELLNSGAMAWSEVVAALGIALDLTALIEFDRWTTPPGAAKRYATRFYAARAPVMQTAEPDGQEVVAAEWLAPARALQEAGAGQRYLMRPTHATLMLLAGQADVAGALKNLADREHIDE